MSAPDGPDGPDGGGGRDAAPPRFEATPEYDAFPSFRALFEPTARYLVLLHLPSGDGVFAEVAQAIAQSPDAASEVVALFAHRNYRAHLVAAAALAVGGAEPRTLEALWAALDAGTWAAPQVAAVAFVLDERFEERARKRLLASGGFPKVTAALGALYRRLPSPRLAVIARLADPALVQSPEGKDGAHYANQWLERLCVVSDAEMRARFVRAPAQAG